MKYLTIVILMLLIQVSASVINAIEVTAGYSVQPSESWYDEIDKESIENKEYFQAPAEQEATSFGFGDFVKGLWHFTKAVFWGVVAVPSTLKNFGLDPTLANYFSIPVYFMYLIGIAQFLANRGTKSMT